VTEATTTRRDKTVRTLFTGAQAIATFDPDTAQAMNITAILNMDGEGMNDLQDYLRKKALGIGLVKPTPEEEQEMQQQAQNQSPTRNRRFWPLKPMRCRRRREGQGADRQGSGRYQALRRQDRRDAGPRSCRPCRCAGGQAQGHLRPDDGRVSARRPSAK
jgi:hypothetical protein